MIPVHMSQCQTEEAPAQCHVPEVPAPTPDAIGEYSRMKGHKSPCPALNALCNHGAYGMPRNGKGVEAHVLARALVEVYALRPWFANFLAYGTILAVNHLRSLTVDLDKLRAWPIAHLAALVHSNPSTKGLRQTEGQPSHFLVKKMLGECGYKHAPHHFYLKNFALWRNKREQEVAHLDMSEAQKCIAAGELALLLQAFGDPARDYEIARDRVAMFLSEERLPAEWLPRRSRPEKSMGAVSTILAGLDVRRAMAEVKWQTYIPYYVWFLVLLSAVAGVVMIVKSIL